MNRTVHRYTLTAKISGDLPYDQADPASYTAALKVVAEKREALKLIGAEITRDDGAPKVVRE